MTSEVFSKQRQDVALARQGQGWPFGAAAEKQPGLEPQQTFQTGIKKPATAGFFVELISD